MADSSNRDYCRFVRARISSNRYLDHCSDLDGHGLHSECKTVRSHALPLHSTGPYYLAMIAPVLVLGSDILSVELYAWIVLGAIIIGGSKLILWATDRALGMFS